MEKYVNSLVNELLDKYLKETKERDSNLSQVTFYTHQIKRIDKQNKNINKFKAGLLLTLALGIGASLLNYTIIRKMSTKTYYKTEVAIVSEDLTIPLKSDYLEEIADGEKINIIEFSPWREEENKNLLITDEYAKRYESDILVYENVPLISGATAIDYLNMDLSDLESRVDKTIYTYNPTLDDVKKFIVRYLQNKEDFITAWDYNLDNTIFYVLLVIIPILSIGGSIKIIRELYEMSEDKKYGEKLKRELLSLEQKIVDKDMEIAEIEDDLLNIYNKYREVIKNEKVHELAKKLIKER